MAFRYFSARSGNAPLIEAIVARVFRNPGGSQVLMAADMPKMVIPQCGRDPTGAWVVEKGHEFTRAVKALM